MNYIVLDLEFNQAFPFKTGIKETTVAECPFEVIQIGAVKLNESFKTAAYFNALIQPKIYPRLHPFVEKITRLTSKTLEGQEDFPSAFERFRDFIGQDKAILCTWGADDIKSLFRNILYYKLDTDSIPNQYINVQGYASSFLHHEAGKAIGLKNAVLEFELETDIPFHDALNDAVYTAKIFEIVHPEVITPTVFHPQTLLTLPKPPRTNMSALFRHISMLMARELTKEEKKLIKLAYFLGRAHSFDSTLKAEKKRSAKSDNET